MRSAKRPGYRAAALACAFAAMLALAGCARGVAGSDPAPTDTPTSISGSWQFESGTDSVGRIAMGNATATFRFDGDRSGGRGPCNSFGATASGATTGAITIVVGIHTDMACLDPMLNTSESRYLAALDAVTRATVHGGALTLSGGGAVLTFGRHTP